MHDGRTARHLLRVCTLLSGLVAIAPAFAAGTPACREIVNQATATWTIGTTTLSDTSNSVSTTVAEILNVSVTWQDASPVLVAAASTGQVLTFLVTNTGNGTDSYSLAMVATLGGDQFDPHPAEMVLDANGNGLFDDGVDLPYVAGVNDPVLAADSSLVVFARCHMPADLLDGDRGDCDLLAISKTGSGTPGTVIDGGGECGNHAVVGMSGAAGSATGSYLKSGVLVEVVKSAAVTDPLGGSEPVPGATITYTIVANVTGSGVAAGLVITDPLPLNTTYLAGSLRLDGSGLTDPSDLDAGDVGGTSPGTVTVTLGDQPAGGPARTVQFTVTID